jgi:3-deoxy-D-manno-octulosonic-acid transferase
MNPLYNIGIYLFKAGVRIASVRSAKLRDLLAGGRATLATLANERKRLAPDGYDVWIHAASLGEFEQGRPLIERLRRERPELKILLTFFSPSGYRVRRGYNKVDTVAYLPIDTPKAVSEFLDAAAPKMAIFVKYEFWANYLEQLHKRGIPTYSISAIFRPSQRFFSRFGGFWKKMLRQFTHIYVQDEASAQLLRRIGVNQVTVAGDTRFDRVADIQGTVRQMPIIDKLCQDSPVTIVVGSSWEPDEDIYIQWAQIHPEVRVIVAPHEFNEARLIKLKHRLGIGTALLSEISSADKMPIGCRALIIDSFGLLSSLYRYADVAYIGGGFGTGIHNINEAAVYGIPVMFGPNHHKFKEAADLIQCGGGYEVTDKASFETTINKLMTDSELRHNSGRAAGSYISRNLGATDKIFSDIF